MFNRLNFLLAFRYLTSKRKEGFISIISIFSLLGIFLGVATLIIVMSVMNGFRHELLTKILGANPHISLYSMSGSLHNYEQEIVKIKALDPGIKYVNPVVESQVMLITDQGSKGIMVKGISHDDIANRTIIFDNISDGGMWSHEDEILLGNNLRFSLGLSVGDRVKLVAPELNQTIFGSIPRVKSYRISGFFETGMYEYDSMLAFIPLAAAQKQFKQENSVNLLEVFIDDPNRASFLATKIENSYYQSPDELIDLRAIDWQKANSSFLSALDVERNVMFLILTLIIIVAAFNIISALIMLVKDKTKNIAILRAMGATKQRIVYIFFICGASIGCTGTILGVVAGLVFVDHINDIKRFLENAFNLTLFDPSVYIFSELPTVVRQGDVLLVISLALGLSFLATIYPAYKASNTHPADILRYE